MSYGVVVNHKQLKRELSKAWKTKKPQFIWGGVGVGKSQAVREWSEDTAARLKKSFVAWNEASTERKKDVMNNPEKFFIFVDKRLLQSDTSDFHLPMPSEGNERLIWLTDASLYVCCMKGITGLLFFDEFNLAPTIVQNVSQQILRDRGIGDISLAEDILVLGAGNRAEDRVFINDMSNAVANRFGHMELECPKMDDFLQWGAEHQLDGRVLTFVTSPVGAEHFYQPTETETDTKSMPTPRTWHYVADEIQDDEDLESIEITAARYVGHGVAVKFTAFIKLQRTISSFDDLLDGKCKMPDRHDTQLMYAITGGLAEYWRQNKTSRTMERIVGKLFDQMPEEFQVLLFTLMRGYDKTEFARQITTSQELVKKNRSSRLVELMEN